MWSGRSSFTSLVVGVFVVYVVHTCWVMYGIVYTRPCAGGGNCIQPYLARRPKLQVSAGVGPFSPECDPGLGRGAGSPLRSLLTLSVASPPPNRGGPRAGLRHTPCHPRVGMLLPCCFSQLHTLAGCPFGEDTSDTIVLSGQSPDPVGVERRPSPSAAPPSP